MREAEQSCLLNASIVILVEIIIRLVTHHSPSFLPPPPPYLPTSYPSSLPPYQPIFLPFTFSPPSSLPHSLPITLLLSALFIGCLKHGFLALRSIARDRTLPFHRTHLERHIRSVFLHGNENTLPSAVDELVDIESAGAFAFYFMSFHFI